LGLQAGNPLSSLGIDQPTLSKFVKNFDDSEEQVGMQAYKSILGAVVIQT